MLDLDSIRGTDTRRGKETDNQTERRFIALLQLSAFRTKREAVQGYGRVRRYDDEGFICVRAGCSAYNGYFQKTLNKTLNRLITEKVGNILDDAEEEEKDASVES